MHELTVDILFFILTEISWYCAFYSSRLISNFLAITAISPLSDGSVVDGGITMDLRRMERELENDIRAKLKKMYPNDTPPHYRLSLEKAPKGTVQNDLSAPGAVHDAALEYADSIHSVRIMEGIAQCRSGRRMSSIVRSQ